MDNFFVDFSKRYILCLVGFDSFIMVLMGEGMGVGDGEYQEEIKGRELFDQKEYIPFQFAYLQSRGLVEAQMTNWLIEGCGQKIFNAWNNKEDASFREDAKRALSLSETLKGMDSETRSTEEAVKMEREMKNIFDAVSEKIKDQSFVFEAEYLKSLPIWSEEKETAKKQQAAWVDKFSDLFHALCKEDEDFQEMCKTRKIDQEHIQLISERIGDKEWFQQQTVH